MNISKDLHGAMLAMGFDFDAMPMGLNRTEPNFLIAKIFFISIIYNNLINL